MSRFSLVGEQTSIGEGIAAFVEEQHFHRDDSAPDVVIAVFKAHDHEQQGQAWRAACRRGAAFLPVLVSPTEITIGPATQPRGRACIGCFQLWTNSRWTGAERDAQAAIATADFAWPASITSLVAPIVMDAIAQMSAPPGPARPMWALNLASGAMSRHLIVSHPQCALCAPNRHDSADAVPITFAPRPKPSVGGYRLAKASALALKCIVDPRAGLVRSLTRYDLSYVLNMTFAAFPVEADPPAAEIGVGRTSSEPDSDCVAILEALERFSGFRPREKQCAVRGAYRDLAGNAIDPRCFILHGAAQQNEPGFKLTPYSDDLQLNWSWAYSFRRRAPVLVPEQLAYYRLPRDPPVNRFVFESSNGCAIGSCREEAIFHGLLELIERDAFLTTWHGRITPTELDLSDAADPDIRALLARTEAFGVKVHVFALNAGLPVAQIWALVADDRPDAVRSYSAAAAHPNPEKAVLSALIEVTTSLIASPPDRVRALRERASAMLADSALVQEQNDHIFLHAHPHAYERLSFLFDGPKATIREFFSRQCMMTPTGDLTSDLIRLAEETMTIAADVLVVDQDFALLRDLGVHCVKVLAPGLHPVTFGHQYRRISQDRVRRAWALHPGTASRSVADINVFPHNFP